MAVTISLKDKISGIAALIKNAIQNGHECTAKETCNFDIEVFGQIAMQVFEHSTLDEIGKAYECMDWCENAEKIING